MKQFKTTTLVLRRVNYGEADRIITFLTPDQGKIGAMAKGVRRPKSKMAGALEPFCEATITFGRGRGELFIVLSTRLEKFYGNILSDYDRLQFGYEAIKLIDRSTEDVVEQQFYQLLHQTFRYLDKTAIAHEITELWFRIQLEQLLGRVPDLAHDAQGKPLDAEATYYYDVYERGLVETPRGELTADHIKFLRLGRDHSPAVLAQVDGAAKLLPGCLTFARNLA